ncbi:hypothetical protein ACO1O0_007684 [Amphichorda felina]
MPAQNTFTLISERITAPNNALNRPMTSKQLKKAHKAANKQPKLSRAEQRKFELAEQERIRKELEKERTAARARAARERKKAKEEAKKEEKRRRGKPLVEVRPSQDTISRFVRGNGSGKKRDERGLDVGQMTSVKEEDELPPVGETKAAVDDRKSCKTGLGTNDSRADDEDQMKQKNHYKTRVERQILDRNTTSRGLTRDVGHDGLIEDLDEMLKASMPTGSSAGEEQAQGQIPSNDVEKHDGTHEKTIHGMSFDDLDDDLFIGLRTSFGENEAETDGSQKTNEVNLEAQYASPRNMGELSKDESEDDILQALGTMFDQGSSAKSQARIASPPRNDQKIGASHEFSSFTEADLDDELWQQLETISEPKPNAIIPTPMTQEASAKPENPNPTRRESSSHETDFGVDRYPPWLPPRQFAPLSTQAVLFNFDEYFPSPSQQEIELKSDSTANAMSSTKGDRGSIATDVDRICRTGHATSFLQHVWLQRDPLNDYTSQPAHSCTWRNT